MPGASTVPQAPSATPRPVTESRTLICKGKGTTGRSQRFSSIEQAERITPRVRAATLPWIGALNLPHMDHGLDPIPIGDDPGITHLTTGHPSRGRVEGNDQVSC